MRNEAFKYHKHYVLLYSALQFTLSL